MPALFILALATFLRLWRIGSKPGWEWDESSYTNIGRGFAEHGVIQSAAEYGHQAVPFMFHPPFYFLLLGSWFKIVGAGVTQARVLSVITALIALTLLFVLARHVMGRTAALVIFAFVAIDPWMVYANRTSWMENSLIVLIVTAMLLYWRALQRLTTSAFIVAGMAFGAAIIYKHTAAYLLIVVGVYYLITRNRLRQHLMLLSGTFSVIAVYLVGMTIAYDGLYWDATVHQWLRTIGSQEVNKVGNGSIRGISGLIEPLMGQYRVFVAMLIVMAIACTWWLVRVIQMVIHRSLDPVRNNAFAFAFAWMTGGILGVTAVQLKFPSYFQIVLIAMYFYLATEVMTLLRKKGHKPNVKRWVVLAMAALALLSVAGFQWRILGRNDNAIKAVGEYAQTHIPRDAIVLTEQPIGNLIDQPFCDIRANAAKCGHLATYVITYTSKNYPGPNDDNVREILSRSTKLWSQTGFKETLTVYRVNPS